MISLTSLAFDRLSNKVVIIIGSLSGIDRVIAFTYIREGVKVVYVDIISIVCNKIINKIIITIFEIL